MLKTPEDFGIQPGYLVRIDLEGELEPHIYPSEYVVIEEQALVVGDEVGMRVASYPYDDYEKVESGFWQFYSEVGNYILRPGPKEGDEIQDIELND